MSVLVDVALEFGNLLRLVPHCRLQRTNLLFVFGIPLFGFGFEGSRSISFGGLHCTTCKHTNNATNTKHIRGSAAVSQESQVPLTTQALRGLSLTADLLVEVLVLLLQLRTSSDNKLFALKVGR